MMARQFLFCCLVSSTACWTQPNRFSHDAFDRVLRLHVNDRGLVNYAALKADPEDLNAYLELLGKYSPEATPEIFTTRADSLAYWLNAYNAFAIAAVIEAYPVKSVRDMKWFYGFFNRIDHNAGGISYTLKHIEHEIVRKVFDVPLIHAALNCASRGCPRLHQRAFVPETLGSVLDARMRVMVGEKRNVLINPQKGELRLSYIFKEFESDFTTWLTREKGLSEPMIVDYLMLYAQLDVRTFLKENPHPKISHFKYDWMLNDQTQLKVLK